MHIMVKYLAADFFCSSVRLTLGLKGLRMCIHCTCHCNSQLKNITCVFKDKLFKILLIGNHVKKTKIFQAILMTTNGL